MSISAPFRLALLAVGLACAVPAAALPIPGTGLSVGVDAEVMTDYRFRGVSRSGGDAAFSGNLILIGDGFYAGARATTLDGLDSFRLRNPRLQDLGDIQFDIYAGHSADLGRGLTLDAGMVYYAFSGSEGASDHFEPYASLSYLIGPVEATVGAKYAWSQRATGNDDMLYLFGEVEAGIPFTPVTLTAHLGRQDWGRYGSYRNWSLGGRYALGPAFLGLRYVDTDLPAGPGRGGTLVASAGVRF